MPVVNTNLTRCHRCGEVLRTFVWLELNAVTGTYHEPGTVPAGESQGLFRFGRMCAARARTDTTHFLAAFGREPA